MSDIAIRVKRLGKMYRIGVAEQRPQNWWEAVKRVVVSPYDYLRRMRRPPTDEETLWALKDVSFEVKRGEVVGVIGRNGAGKSTLLKILSRITEPTEGWADIYGRVGSLLEVGTGFHPELTGRENVYLNGAILGMKRTEIDRKFDDIVSFAEIEKFIDTPVKRYSSGMYVRLAFAVAAHLEPEILLVDEVLAVGDAAFQKKCLGKMSSVAQEGRTVLFVSHNMGAVRTLCERALWLESGEIALSGPVVSVTDSYLKSMFDTRGSAVDLRTARRGHGLGERFRLVNLEFNKGQPIRHGESLIVRFEYETYKEVHGVSVGIGFNSIEGVRLMSLDSDLSDTRHDLADGVRGTVVMRLDELLLQPGRYQIGVGARSGGKVALEYLPACLQVEILPGSNTPGQIIRPDGGVRMPAQWEWVGS